MKIMEFLAANLQILYAIAAILIIIAAASLVYTNFSQKKSGEIDELVRNFEIQANASRSLLRELNALDQFLLGPNLPAVAERVAITERVASLAAQVRRQADDFSSIADRVASLARQPNTSRDDLLALESKILIGAQITSEQVKSLSDILVRVLMGFRDWQAGRAR